ncbi:hypothetical protein P4639_22515 [Priestia megaterium]|uniref:hypothetical protein n=1 Tax=Priestia megaterium TaxID=1404 RepID=UPI002E20A9C1|nr:hypothetical protein [Priestia megaterium]
MIKEHVLNIELSRQVYENCSDNILPKHCYNNVWNVLQEYSSCFLEGDWFIAFGYVHATQNLYARHAFIVNKDGEAIDPTLYTLSYFDEDEEREHKHVSFSVMTMREYIDKISKNDNQPALFGKFREEEKEAWDWASERGFVFAG